MPSLLTDTFDAVAARWEELHIWPEHAVDDALDRLEHLRQWGTRRGLLELSDLEPDLAGAWIRDLTEARSLHGFASRDTTQRIHVVRNTLAVIHHTDRYNRRINLPPANRAEGLPLPDIAPRFTRDLGRWRPAYDDEIALLRITCNRLQVQQDGQSHHVAVANYTLHEAGVTPAEITLVRTDALDVASRPTQVLLDQHGDLPARTIPLDTWQRGTLAYCLQHHHRRDEPNHRLCYDGGHAGTTGGQSSTSGAIGRLIGRAGLPQTPSSKGRLTGMGISRWSTVSAAKADNWSLARQISGAPYPRILAWLDAAQSSEVDPAA